jgi:hypothetical protein
MGTLRMDDLYDRALVGSIQQKFAERIEDDAHGAVRKNSFAVVDGHYSRHLKIPLQSLPELGQLINDGLKKAVEECYGAHFRVLNVRCWRNYHVPGGISDQSEVFSDRWHCDSYLTSTWKLFVLLSDVTEDHGPTNILSLPYSKRLARRRAASGHGERWFRFSDEEIAIDDRSQVLQGPDRRVVPICATRRSVCIGPAFPHLVESGTWLSSSLRQRRSHCPRAGSRRRLSRGPSVRTINRPTRPPAAPAAFRT